MEINADFTRPIVVHSDDLPWVASPTPGVDRRMLDRIGGEIARATTIVRFAPARHFPAHVHGGGEEFLVLEGSFHDASGDFPAGTYVRNPIGSSHAPWSGPAGATLLVKLHQFAATDTLRVVIDTDDARGWQILGQTGISLRPLHAHGAEQVTLVQMAPGALLAAAAVAGGEEILVLAGELLPNAGDERPLTRGTWRRSPPGAAVRHRAGAGGARLWRKIGHLAHAAAAPAA